MNIFIHSLADVRTNDIGSGTRIWQFCVVLPGAQIGSDCNICSNSFIEGGVVIGNQVTIKNGVQLYDGCVLDDSVFVGPNVSFTNDRFARSRRHDFELLTTRVGVGASIGAGCVLLPGITIGPGAMIGAGSVVTRDVASHTLVYGNPARFVRSLGLDTQFQI